MCSDNAWRSTARAKRLLPRPRGATALPRPERGGRPARPPLCGIELHSESGSGEKPRPPRGYAAGAFIRVTAPEKGDGTPAQAKKDHRESECVKTRPFPQKNAQQHPTQDQQNPKERNEEDDEEGTVSRIVDATATGAQCSTEKQCGEQGESKPRHRAETSVQSSFTHAYPAESSSISATGSATFPARRTCPGLPLARPCQKSRQERPVPTCPTTGHRPSQALGTPTEPNELTPARVVEC